MAEDLVLDWKLMYLLDQKLQVVDPHVVRQQQEQERVMVVARALGGWVMAEPRCPEPDHHWKKPLRPCPGLVGESSSFSSRLPRQE